MQSLGAFAPTAKRGPEAAPSHKMGLPVTWTKGLLGWTPASPELPCPSPTGETAHNAGFLWPATKAAAELEHQAVTEHLPLAALHSQSHCWAPVLSMHGVILSPRRAPVLSRLADA